MDVVGDCPVGQLVPLVHRPPVNGQTELQVDVLSIVQVNEDLLDYVGKVFTIDHVISLHEDLSESGLSDGIVFGIEFVKSMECISILRNITM